MRSKSVVVELTPTRLSVAVFRGGRVVIGRYADLDPGAWEDAWKGSLASLDAPLAALLKDTGVRRGSAVAVFHRGPGAFAEIYSYPTAPRQALDAARLAMGDAAESDASLSAAALLARDRAGSPAQTHVLAATETALGAAALAGLIDRAGLRLERSCPMDAATLPAAVTRATASPGPGVTGVLYIGEHNAALAAGTPGRLEFVRRVGFGIESLVEAVMAAANRRPGSAPISRDAARKIVFTVGIPTREQVLDAASDLRGQDVLPAMQPALQRLVIEVKQSLRFGLQESSRDGAALVVTGPGAVTPGLAELIGEQAETRADRCDRAARFDYLAPFGAGSDLAATRRAPVAINLLAPAALAVEVAGRARQAVWVGAAVAMALLGAEWMRTSRALRAVNARIAAIEPSTRGGLSAAEQQRVTEIATILAVAERGIVEQFAGRCSPPAALADLARLTPPNVRFTALNLLYDGETPVVDIEGALAHEESADRAGALKGYLDALAASPLVSRVQLGATQRADLDGREAQRFAVRAFLRPTPPPWTPGIAAAEPDS